MKRKRRVGIIGHFGSNEPFLDGQTVKTKTLYTELKKAVEWDIYIVDTYYKSKNPVKLVWDTLRCLISCKDVIILLSGNGMRLYFPLLWMAKRILGTHVYHDVIGGNLDQYIRKYPRFRKYLNSFEANWVETNKLKQKVDELGLTNASVIPNFKRLSIVNEGGEFEAKVPFRFCTFSRVMKEKGIEDAIAAIETINRENNAALCTLDIYGAVEHAYAERFKEIMNQATNAVRYCGIVPYDKSVAVLKEYYALLFPTFWEGEGFPGTIVDAFSAGLPVIARDWNSNAEIIENRLTGIIYPKDGILTLKHAIECMINNGTEVAQMRNRCIEEAELFQPDMHIAKIIQSIT